MGKGVRKSSDSSIRIDFMYQGRRCTERVRLSPTAANIKYCDRWRDTILHEIATGTFNYAKHFPDSPRAKMGGKTELPTITQALDAFIRSSESTLQRSTWLDYRRSALNHLQPAFGHLRLDELKRSHVRAWAGELQITQKRLNNILLPLRAVINQAFDDEDLDRNPLHGFTARPHKDAPTSDGDIDPFTPEELHAICEAFPHQTLRNQVMFNAWTGLRTSELFALRWNQIDLVHNTMRIDRAFVAGQDKKPKTKAGKRTIELLEPALTALKAQKKLTYLAGGHVFIDPRTGKQWMGDNAFREYPWKRALKKAGVRYRYPYQLRHTFASMLVSADENHRWIADQMGHTDVTMVAKVYGKWMPEMAKEKAGSAAVALWKKK